MVYVDDLVFASSNQQIRDIIMTSLQETFEIKDTGDLTWVIGSRVSQDLEEGVVTMDQQLYIEDYCHFMLGKPSATQLKERAIPCNENILKLESLAEGESVDPEYQSAIGKLGWIVHLTRFDCGYAYSRLSRFASCGGEQHMSALRFNASYLRKTSHYCLTWGSQVNCELLEFVSKHSKFCPAPNDLPAMPALVFTDSSSGGERPDAGYVILLFGGTVASSHFRLGKTPLSSAEAEYVTASKAGQGAITIKQFLLFVLKDKIPPIPIFCDNLSAIQLAESNLSSRRMRHVMTRLAFLRELVEDAEIKLHHIYSEGQL